MWERRLELQNQKVDRQLILSRLCMLAKENTNEFNSIDHVWAESHFAAPFYSLDNSTDEVGDCNESDGSVTAEQYT